MSLIYGNKFIDEDILYEQSILNEMHFSKKDLYDPKTLEKIIKSKEKYASTIDFLYNLFIIIGLIGSLALGIFVNFLSAVGGFSLIMYIFYKTYELVDQAPLKRFNKHSQKFKEKVMKLKNKSEEALNKNPKNKDKYQQIINNCNKVLKEIEDRERKARELLEKQEYEAFISCYEEFISWCEKPFVVGHTGDGSSLDMFSIPKQLGIPESSLIKVIKEKGKFTKDWDMLYGTDFELLYKSKNIFLGDEYVHISCDDDYNVFYSKRHNKIFFTDADTEYKETSLYREAREDIYSKDELEEVDRELGYYIITKCPEEVKRKEFPIKL